MKQRVSIWPAQVAMLGILAMLSLGSCGEVQPEPGVSLIVPGPPVGVGINDTIIDFPFACNAYVMFTRDADVYRFHVGCAPFFDFDSVFARIPIPLKSGRSPENLVLGNYACVVASRPIGTTWASAESEGSLQVETYIAPIRAEDSDLDGFWDVEIEYGGEPIELSGAAVQVVNRIEEQRISRCLVNYFDGLFYRQVAIYWQESI